MSSPKNRRTVIKASNVRTQALADLLEGLVKPQLWWHFAAHDIKQRFRRSTFGPFWITLSMGIMVAALGFVFSQVFNQPIDIFIPYLATGLIFWGLLTSVVNEGCTAFIQSEGYIKNVPMPLSVHYYRTFARNMIIWLFNMAIYLIVYLIFRHELSWAMVLFIPGFVLFCANIFLMGLVAGILSTRYRDIPQVIGNMLQVVFFVTPIFWSVDALPERPALVALNPFYHLIEIVRAPLLGAAPAPQSWLAASLMVLLALPVTAWLYRRAYARIPYWV